ncbi:Phage integrase family protein [Pseudomonas grimontii]|uniref:Phage integrase family protein n=2 Tax=Pseudomonas grimontii TaxID=129847 RepID=A0ABY0THH2_9PSED|nr:Phage integrase family protein [Pseudomonas grimontii]
MARLESIQYRTSYARIELDSIHWVTSKEVSISDLPALFWITCMPWREANSWFREQVLINGKDSKTALSNANALQHYATWLESEKLDWKYFPLRKDDRCLLKYRGHLIKERDAGNIAPSTATARMNHVIRFYRWVKKTGLISPNLELWTDITVAIRTHTSVGFERTLQIQSCDLSIPNAGKRGTTLEDGVFPVSAVDRELILDIAEMHCPPELYYMLLLGFHTGMRVQTICDLKIKNITMATRHPVRDKTFLIAVGPTASPPVRTKYQISGLIEIPEQLLNTLTTYANCIRRAKREIFAKQEHKDLLFLTSRGNSYARRGTETSPAINVAMNDLRKQGLSRGVAVMQGFSFHRSRATFATEYTKVALSINPKHALSMVKNAMLHKNESTTLAYIKFVENTPIKEAASNKFTQEFLGRYYGNAA